MAERNLRSKGVVDYNALHSGVKNKKSVQNNNKSPAQVMAHLDTLSFDSQFDTFDNQLHSDT